MYYLVEMVSFLGMVANLLLEDNFFTVSDRAGSDQAGSDRAGSFVLADFQFTGLAEHLWGRQRGCSDLDMEVVRIRSLAIDMGLSMLPLATTQLRFSL